MKLTEAQQAAKDVVRKRRIERDNAREALLIQIENLKATFMRETEEALKSAVWAASDKGVPAAHLKAIMNITDHRTFQRYLDGYVKAEPKDWEYDIRNTDDGPTAFISRILDHEYKEFPLFIWNDAITTNNTANAQLLSEVPEEKVRALFAELEVELAKYGEGIQ